MDYQVLNKPIQYEGCPIYIRQAGERFEYLTVVNNEIYTAFIVARKSLAQRLLFKTYTPDQIDKITNYMIAMAQATIDSVKGIEHPPEKSV